MRAPPLAEKHTNGQPISSARSAAQREALADHRAHRAAHVGEVERGGDQVAPLQRALHRDQRVALAGGLLRGLDAVGVLLLVLELAARRSGRARRRSRCVLPASNSAASRARARIAMWRLHFGQTSRFSSSSGRYSTAPQRSHFSHRPSGTLRACRRPSVRMREGISFFSQDMRCVFRSGSAAWRAGRRTGWRGSPARVPRVQRTGRAARARRRGVQRRAQRREEARWPAAAGSAASASAATSALPTTTPSASCGHRRGRWRRP